MKMDTLIKMLSYLEAKVVLWNALHDMQDILEEQTISELG